MKLIVAAGAVVFALGLAPPIRAALAAAVLVVCALFAAPAARADYYCDPPQIMANGTMTYLYCYGDGWSSVTTCINGRCSVRYR